MTTDVDEGRRCYEAPRMERLGNLPELTQQNFLSTETDFSFAGVLLQGS